MNGIRASRLADHTLINGGSGFSFPGLGGRSLAFFEERHLGG